MKDEYGGGVIIKFCGLKSKMYAIIDESNNEKCTIKGHNGFIEFNEFENTLFQKNILRHKMRGIKCKNHNLGTYESNKTSLSCFDDKRYTRRNCVNILACGHKDIVKKKKKCLSIVKHLQMSSDLIVKSILD